MFQPKHLLTALLLPGVALVARAGGFDPVRDVRITFVDGAVTVAAPAGSHLKARFLSVTRVPGAGNLTAGALPPATERDEAGDPIYHGSVRLPVAGQGLAGEVVLEVHYQPCTEGEDGVCFMPMVRRLTVAAGAIPAATAPVAAVAGPEAAAAVVEDLAGRPFTLASLRGQITVVDFLASWCGPCRKSFPALDRLYGTYGPRGLAVVGVALDEEREAVTRFLDAVPVGFQIAWDGSGRLAKQYRIESMPTTLLLDREGREVARFEGGGRMAQEEAAVGALLAGLPLPPGAGSTLPPGLRATGELKAWKRGHLADPIMNLDGDPLSKALWEHIHASKEGAAGNGGAAGGGCGCN